MEHVIGLDPILFNNPVSNLEGGTESTLSKFAGDTEWLMGVLVFRGTSKAGEMGQGESHDVQHREVLNGEE